MVHNNPLFVKVYCDTQYNVVDRTFYFQSKDYLSGSLTPLIETT